MLRMQLRLEPLVPGPHLAPQDLPPRTCRLALPKDRGPDLGGPEPDKQMPLREAEHLGYISTY